MTSSVADRRRSKGAPSRELGGRVTFAGWLAPGSWISSRALRRAAGREAVGRANASVGAAGGAVVGGLVGKGIAEKIGPTREDAYWREHHSRQGWAKNRSYDEFRPAYRVGYEGYARYGGVGTFEDREEELRREYEAGQPALTWAEARPASQAAWRKFDQKNPPNTAVDSYGNPKK